MNKLNKILLLSVLLLGSESFDAQAMELVNMSKKNPRRTLKYENPVTSIVKHSNKDIRGSISGEGESASGAHVIENYTRPANYRHVMMREILGNYSSDRMEILNFHGIEKPPVFRVRDFIFSMPPEQFELVQYFSDDLRDFQRNDFAKSTITRKRKTYDIIAGDQFLLTLSKNTSFGIKDIEGYLTYILNHFGSKEIKAGFNPDCIHYFHQDIYGSFSFDLVIKEPQRSKSRMPQNPKYEEALRTT